MTKKYALDAGYPWGLRIGPFSYLTRECFKTMKPELYDTYAEAFAAAIKLNRERNSPCTLHNIVTYED